MADYNERLKQMESSGDSTAVNQFGYAGSYQMGADALSDLGYLKKKPKDVSQKDWMSNPSNWKNKNKINSMDDFLGDAKAQEKIQGEWNNVLDKRTKHFKLDQYYGKTIDGVEITPDNVRAAAHLTGHGNVMKALKSGDLSSFKDGNQVSAKDYMEKISQQPQGSTVVPQEVTPVTPEKGALFTGFKDIGGFTPVDTSNDGFVEKLGRDGLFGRTFAGNLGSEGTIAEGTNAGSSEAGTGAMMSPVHTGLSPEVLSGRAKAGDKIAASAIKSNNAQTNPGNLLEKQIDWDKMGKMLQYATSGIKGSSRQAPPPPGVRMATAPSGAGQLGSGFSFKDYIS
jgi:hypothetical protein